MLRATMSTGRTARIRSLEFVRLALKKEFPVWDLLRVSLI